MGWPLAQVVDNLDQSNVLFDFNPGRRSEQQMWLGSEDFDYGTPEWDSSVLGLVEGGRTISLAFRAQGRAAEAQISRLSEILTRTAPGYLMWQTRRDSDPVWFRLHRNASANPLDFSTVWADDADRSLWRWKVDLVADAFALGARQDLTSTTALAKASAPILPPVEILDPILGDAPAPLNLDIDAGDLTGYQTQLMSWAMDPNATVDVWSQATVSGVVMTGGAFSTARIDSPVTPAPGQYRGLLYVTRAGSSGDSRWQVGLDDGFGNALTKTAPVTHAPPDGTLDGWWVDCGRLNLPPGVDFIDLAEDCLPELEWQVRFNSTDSNNWTVNQFALAPVQTVNSRAATTVLGVQWGTGADAVFRVDSERNRVGMVDAAGKWVMMSPVPVDGAFPRVHPGARNFLGFLPRTRGVVKHSYGTPGEAKLWYYPRHLHVGSR